MPLYDYDCAACGRRFEVIHGVHADGPTACPACGSGPVRKAVSAPAVHFKGSGWAKKERRTAPTSANKDAGKDGGKDGGKDEGKDGGKEGATPGAKEPAAAATASTTSTESSGASSTTSAD